MRNLIRVFNYYAKAALAGIVSAIGSAIPPIVALAAAAGLFHIAYYYIIDMADVGTGIIHQFFIYGTIIVSLSLMTLVLIDSVKALINKVKEKSKEINSKNTPKES